MAVTLLPISCPVIEETDKGNKTTLLYSGPTREAEVVFPAGKFHLFAEIHEEAEAFTVFDIDVKFNIYLPDQEEYEAFNLDEQLALYTSTGDQARVSQILQADVIYCTVS